MTPRMTISAAAGWLCLLLPITSYALGEGRLGSMSGQEHQADSTHCGGAVSHLLPTHGAGAAGSRPDWCLIVLSSALT